MKKSIVEDNKTVIGAYIYTYKFNEGLYKDII